MWGCEIQRSVRNKVRRIPVSVFFGLWWCLPWWWWWPPRKHVGTLLYCISTELDRLADNNMIDLHGTNNTVKFTELGLSQRVQPLHKSSNINSGWTHPTVLHFCVVGLSDRRKSTALIIDFICFLSPPLTTSKHYTTSYQCFIWFPVSVNAQYLLKQIARSFYSVGLTTFCVNLLDHLLHKYLLPCVYFHF